MCSKRKQGMNKPLKNCFIITSQIDGKLEEIVLPSEDDFVICADSGYLHALSAGVKPDIIIGDFDSLKLNADEIPQSVKIIRLPVEKDETDTGKCIEYAVENGFKSIFIIGGIGGRLDHTAANLQNIARFSKDDIKIIMVDSNNYLTCLANDSVKLPKMPGYTLSLLSFTDKCENVSVKGTRYTLEKQDLTNIFPLGVSNEFKDDFAEISVEKGKLLIIMSKDV